MSSLTGSDISFLYLDASVLFKTTINVDLHVGLLILPPNSNHHMTFNLANMHEFLYIVSSIHQISMLYLFEFK